MWSLIARREVTGATDDPNTWPPPVAAPSPRSSLKSHLYLPQASACTEFLLRVKSSFPEVPLRACHIPDIFPFLTTLPWRHLLTSWVVKDQGRLWAKRRAYWDPKANQSFPKVPASERWGIYAFLFCLVASSFFICSFQSTLDTKC